MTRFQNSYNSTKSRGKYIIIVEVSVITYQENRCQISYLYNFLSSSNTRGCLFIPDLAVEEVIWMIQASLKISNTLTFSSWYI